MSDARPPAPRYLAIETAEPHSRKLHGLHQSDEVGIVADPIEARLAVDPRQPRGALLKGAAHPGDDLIRVFQNVAECGDPGGRDLLIRGALLQLLTALVVSGSGTIPSPVSMT